MDMILCLDNSHLMYRRDIMMLGKKNCAVSTLLLTQSDLLRSERGHTVRSNDTVQYSDHFS